jgi:hypothetical protein
LTTGTLPRSDLLLVFAFLLGKALVLLLLSA